MMLLVIGHARHGKDTVADILREDLGMTPQSSSMFCASRVIMPFFESLERPYASIEECFEDRVNYRDLWHELIVAYNRDPTRLTREIHDAGYDVYVGMRSAREYHATRFMFSHVLWIDASGRGLPPEPKSSMQITYDPSYMIRIDNSGSVKDLRWKVMEAVGALV